MGSQDLNGSRAAGVKGNRSLCAGGMWGDSHPWRDEGQSELVPSPCALLLWRGWADWGRLWLGTGGTHWALLQVGTWRPSQALLTLL